MKKLFTFTLIMLLSIGFVSKGTYAQKISPKWEVGVHGGPTLFWGDLSVTEDEGDYLAKLSDENQWSFGLNAGYRLMPFALLAADFSYGQLQGFRDTYAEGNMLNQSFETEYFDYSLTMRLNLNDLLAGYSNNRFFSVYLLAGYGQIHYRSVTHQLTTGAYIQSVGYEDQGSTKADMATAWRIPLGGGLQFSLNDHFNLRLETYANRVNVDDLDATAGGSTDVNDIYSYTSLAVVYKFNMKRKTFEPVEEEPEPEPVIDDEPVQVNLIPDFPAEVEPESEETLVYRIEKEDLGGPARFELTLPEGIEAVSARASGAEFSFKDQQLVLAWDSLPGTERVTVRAQLQIDTIASGNYTMAGEFQYQEEGEDKKRVISRGFRVPSKPEPVAAEPEPEPEEEPEPEDDKPEIVYRVQVRAIYNGKQSTGKVKNTYSLEEAVYEHFHKGYSKYSAGDFKTYRKANEYKRELRNGKVPDAFVVAFADEERLNSLEDVEKVLESYQEEVGAELTETEKEPEAGTYYKVQVAAISANKERVPASVFAGKFDIEDQNIEIEQSNGWYRYTIGKYKNRAEAERKLGEIKANVPDAFIAKYVDGTRM
ncbi:MAG: SPOR domain-containing protein [Bacteroidales bacterium]